jgi:peptidoglycan/LPS O-acetylase OafA/YrhL
MRSLGLSSYSLYLTHGPIVVVVSERIVAGRVSPGAPAFLASLALTLPLTVGFARLYASVFERPFLHRRRAGGPAAARAGIPGTVPELSA